jgi:hypothetical protein
VAAVQRVAPAPPFGVIRMGNRLTELADEDGPVETVVPSGDLYVLIGLAKAAVRARAALRSNQDGE